MASFTFWVMTVMIFNADGSLYNSKLELYRGAFRAQIECTQAAVEEEKALQATYDYGSEMHGEAPKVVKMVCVQRVLTAKN